MTELIIILGYFVVMLAIGAFSFRRARTSDDFFVAGRQSSAWVVTGSLLATIIGGSATVGLAGRGYTMGLTGAWWILVGSVGLLCLGLFLAKKVRQHSLYTLPELVQTQYGRAMGLGSSLLIVVAWVAVTAAQIIAAGKILSVLTTGSPVLWMVIFSVVFVVYTVLGGQKAILRTDSIQSIVIFAGIIGAVIMVINQVGGFTGLSAAIGPEKFAFPVSPAFNTADLLGLLLVVGLTYVVGPDMYSRLFCAKDAATARRATLWTALLLVPLAFAIAIIGMGAAALFPGIAPETAFPTVIRDVLPPVIGGIVLAALLCAIMSSADTVLMSASTILAVDVFGRSKGSSSPSRNEVPRSRIVIVVLGGLSLLVALKIGGVISALLLAYTVYSAGVILPVLFGFFKDRLKLNSAGAMASLIGGGGLALYAKLLPFFDQPLPGFLEAISGILPLNIWLILFSVILLFTGSYLRRLVQRT